MNRSTVYLFEKDPAGRRTLLAALEDLGLSPQPVASLSDLAVSDASPEAGDLLVCGFPGTEGGFRESLRTLRKRLSALPIILVVPPDSSREALDLLKEGLVSHAAGAENPAALYSAVRSGQERAALLKERASALNTIGRLKKRLAAELRKSASLEETHDSTLENFMAALDVRDVETFGHSKTVSRYCHVLAEALGIRDPKALSDIRKGALLHDAGKIAIPDAILKKPGPLTAGEWEKIRRHPSLGLGLVRNAGLSREVGNIVLCHHEKYDGTGYPAGLKDGAIPMEARIFALADALDAITSHRPYRPPRDFDAARREIIRDAGTHFDPEVVDAFCALDVAVWEKIRFETTRLLPHMEIFT